MTTEGYGRGDSDISNASDQSAAMIDEAYRRVGYRLSRRVGGDDSSTVATVDSLGDHPLSAFHPPFSNDRIRNHAEVSLMFACTILLWIRVVKVRMGAILDITQCIIGLFGAREVRRHSCNSPLPRYLLTFACFSMSI